MTRTGSGPMLLRHHLEHDFLEPEERDELLAWLVEQRDAFVPSRVFGEHYEPEARDSNHDPEARNSLTLPPKALGPWRDRLRARFTDRLPEFCDAVGIARFEPAAIEVQPTAYGDGAFFIRHLDTRVITHIELVRMLSAVYYLHAEPKRYSGGALRIHAILGEGHLDLVPEQNSLVAFPSWSPHEVLPVSCPSQRFEDNRFAINFWAHVARSDVVKRANQ